jgi:hypothetical protein
LTNACRPTIYPFLIPNNDTHILRLLAKHANRFPNPRTAVAPVHNGGMAVAVLISPQPRDNNNGDPASDVRAIRSPFGRGARRRGPDTARRCVTLDNRERLQQHTRRPTTIMNQTNEGNGWAYRRVTSFGRGRVMRAIAVRFVGTCCLLLLLLLPPSFLLLVGQHEIHFDRHSSPLTQMVTTPVRVGLGRGSQNYRLTNKHFVSNRNLLRSGALLSLVVVEPFRAEGS